MQLIHYVAVEANDKNEWENKDDDRNSDEIKLPGKRGPGGEVA